MDIDAMAYIPLFKALSGCLGSCLADAQLRTADPIAMDSPIRDLLS